MTIPTVSHAARCSVWRLLPGQELRHHGWDGSFVLYNNCSGDTHLLDANVMGVLLALRAGPRSEQNLAGGYSGGTPAAPATAPLTDVLYDLAVLSLIEPVPC